MAYNDDVPSGQGLDGLPGFFIRKSGMPHATQFLSFQHPTVFRIQPEINSQGNEVVWRMGHGQGEFSNWIKGVRIAAKMGVNGRFTCLANVAGKNSRELGPIDVFATSIHKAIERNRRAFPEDWEDWIKYNPKSGLKLSKTEYYALVQGLLFEHGGNKFMDENGNPQPKHPTILCLKTSARYRLQDLCNVEKPGYNGHPEDYNNRYPIGDVFSLGGGRLLKIFPVPDDGSTRSHYEIETLPTVMPLPVSVAREWVPWEELLHYLTEEEQINLLVEHYTPEIVDFALGKGQYAHLIPHHVRGTFDRMRSSVQVPAMPAVQYGVQGYQQPVQPQFHAAPTPQFNSAPQPTFYQVPVASPQGVNFGGAQHGSPAAAPAVNPDVNFAGQFQTPAHAPESVVNFGGQAMTPAPPAPQPPRRANVPQPPQVVPVSNPGVPAVFQQPTGSGVQSNQPVGDPAQTNFNDTLTRLRTARQRVEGQAPGNTENTPF